MGRPLAEPWQGMSPLQVNTRPAGQGRPAARPVVGAPTRGVGPTESITIRELTTTDEFRAAYPIMHQLRTHLDEASFLRLLDEIRADDYRLFGLWDEGALVALAGIGLRTTLAHGRHLWVYDLVTDEQRRSRGYGARLLAFLEELAREQGCVSIGLSSGVQRLDAHRFYEEKMNFRRASYVFFKKLEPA